MKTNVKKRVLAFILSVLAVITMLPVGAMSAGTASEAEITKKRNELVDYFHSMATVKWTAGQNFKVKAGGEQTYYKNQVYYGLPYASVKGGSAVSLESFNKELKKTGGKINGAIGQSDCSTTLGVAYKKVLGVSQMWSVSCYSSSSYGFSKVSNYSDLKPGDVLVKGTSHVMMVVSVNKSKKTVTVTHQSSAYFKYDPNTDTTGGKTYNMKTRNCSWGVNQAKSFDSLKSGNYQGYVHKDLKSGSPSTSGFKFNSVGVDSITETDANIYAKFDLQHIDSAGFYFGTSSSSLKKISKSLKGDVDGAGNFNSINYPLSKWYGNLKANTTYYYKLYVVKSGKEYQTEVKSFSTKTSVLTIKFNGNGGTIKSDRFKLVSNMVYEGSKLLESKWEYDKTSPYGLWNADSFGLTRNGYTFVGWGTTPSGGKVFDQDDVTVKPSDMSPNIKNGSCTITLYAIWKPITGSFNYNANGGSGNTSAFNVTFGNNFSVSNNSCKRSGYKLVGWNVKRNGDNTWFVGGSAGWVNDSTIKQKGYTKKLYANGSSWTFEDSWVRKDAKSESYTFYAVWEYVPTKAPKLDKKSISLKYKDSDTISVTNDVKVTWESSNSSVVSVDQYGNITAKKKGNATIIATSSDGLTAECQITVRMEWWQTLLKIISFGIY